MRFLPIVLAALVAAAPAAQAQEIAGHAPVNGIEMYYEVHGSGEPVVLLHGGLGASGMFAPILLDLANGRTVIAVDMQAHGRTRPGDRPMTFENLADDVAALIQHLGYERASVMGYSLGGLVALKTAIRHPEDVERLVVVSAPFSRSGWHTYSREGMAAMGAHLAEAMKQTPMYEMYAQIAPDPSDWPRLLDGIGRLGREDYDWSKEVARLRIPVLLALGDWDSVRPEHVAEFYTLLGGGARDAQWDRSGMGSARMAIIPNTTHYDVFTSPALVAAAAQFLDAPAEEFADRVTVEMYTDDAVTLTRTIHAPHQRVWDAWTAPEALEQWMTGPPGWEGPHATADLRVGGAYALAWHDAGGEELAIRGEYTEIEPGWRLVSTEAWSGDWPETINTLTLTDENGRTVLSLTLQYPSAEARDAALATGMVEGMAATFDALDRYLAEQR